MRVRRGNIYGMLAVVAGGRAGLTDPDPEAVAEDPAARDVRDAIWDEYERVLRDTNTYSLDAIVAWLNERAVDGARSSVQRDRKALLSKERAITLRAEKARAVIEAVEASGEHDVLRGGRVLAGQLIFQALSELPADALEELSPGGVLKMVRELSYLSKTHAETDLLQQKVAEMRRAFDEELAAAKRKAGAAAGGITDEMIADVRRAVFGSAS